MTHALLLALSLTSGAARNAETAQLDLSRYLGTWYEIARYDHFFERGCVGVTATYEQAQGDRIKVTNRCVKGPDLQGEVKKIEGKAWVPDPEEPGKLKVQFFWPFRADYWVLEVAPDYSWALVGDPSGKTCWILSRTPQLPDDVYETLTEKLRARGYDPEKLIRVLQPENPR